jgi:hypothetical protein
MYEPDKAEKVVLVLSLVSTLVSSVGCASRCDTTPASHHVRSAFYERSVVGAEYFTDDSQKGIQLGRGWWHLVFFGPGCRLEAVSICADSFDAAAQASQAYLITRTGAALPRRPSKQAYAADDECSTGTIAYEEY